MATLSIQENYLLTATLESPGFQILIDALQAQVDDVLEEVRVAKTDEQERRALNLWRAKLEQLALLKTFKLGAVEVNLHTVDPLRYTGIDGPMEIPDGDVQEEMMQLLADGFGNMETGE